MTKAPRDGVTKVMIAVMGAKKVRQCVYNTHKKRWSGLMPGETPLCFIVLTHPGFPEPKLPEGMKL